LLFFLLLSQVGVIDRKSMSLSNVICRSPGASSPSQRDDASSSFALFCLLFISSPS
jgi:hypothetical protein